MQVLAHAKTIFHVAGEVLKRKVTVEVVDMHTIALELYKRLAAVQPYGEIGRGYSPNLAPFRGPGVQSADTR